MTFCDLFGEAASQLAFDRYAGMIIVKTRHGWFFENRC